MKSLSSGKASSLCQIETWAFWSARSVDVFRASLNPSTGQTVPQLAYLQAGTLLKEEITMLITLWIQHLFIIKDRARRK